MKEWNLIDIFLSKWRCKFLKKYLSKNKIFCDYGWGQKGRLVIEISKQVKKAYGYDPKLKKEFQSKNIILTRDINKINQKFDIISSIAVIEHLEKPKEMLEEIYNKLNRKGLLILTTPDKKAKGLLEFLAFKLHIINEEEIRDHKHYFNKRELIKILKENKFRIIKHKYFQLGFNNLIIGEKE